ncbi:hypothetical protein C2G38_2243353 [Gigaspora rosea]|uniref:Uncharacterized protein n=1 Tax=Gigaspora rosea TaxID=44941 RepID=A0A397VMX3_9GLOM|nr:hypothetical protein C2G38_2243353 [Gigaspora rosea]
MKSFQLFCSHSPPSIHVINEKSLDSLALGYDGVKVIADALFTNTTLEYLSIRYINSPESGKLLAKALYDNTVLSSLSLGELVISGKN